MPSGQKIRFWVTGEDEIGKSFKFDFTVAEDVRVGCYASLIGIKYRFEDVVPVFLLKVDDSIGDVQKVGDFVDRF